MLGRPGTQQTTQVTLKIPVKRTKSLTQRSEFLRVRGGVRFSCGLFVLEGKRRPDDEFQRFGPDVRFGLTVSKKVGNAVVRNRVKRRLRAALAELRPHGPDGLDIVIIARTPLSDCPFEALKSQLLLGFAKARMPTLGTPKVGAAKVGHHPPKPSAEKPA